MAASEPVNAELDLRVAQVRVTASVSSMGYEVSALPEGSVSAREAAPYTVFVEPVDRKATTWMVLAGLREVPVYLTSDGQVTGTRQTYDLDTALQVARRGAVQRREGLFSLTADQLIEARSGTLIAHQKRPSASQAAASAAWGQPVRQALAGHAARPPAPARARPSHADTRERVDHSAER